MAKLKTKITAIVTFETEEEIKNVQEATKALGEHLQETVKEALPTLFDDIDEQSSDNAAKLYKEAIDNLKPEDLPNNTTFIENQVTREVPEC